VEPSNRTEFHPLRRQLLMNARSGAMVQVQADRYLDSCRQLLPHGEQQVDANGPNGLNRRLNDEGERCSTAAASTASRVRSLTTLIAATP
jgi:hypothetical protein